MTKNAEIGWIDGLKGISILGIILTHYPHLDYEFMDVIACSGARCVQFFFVISSFLIFQSLYRKFGDNNISFFEGSKWFIRRLILLMPMYYLAIIIGLLVNEHGIRYYLGSIDNVSVINIISHFLFLHGFSPYYVNSIIGVEWYVGVLVMIYILAPYMFNKIKTLKKAVSVCIISFIICRCAQSLLCSLNYLPDDYLFNIYFTNFSILGQFPIVMLGVIFYFLYKDKMCKVTTKSACMFGGGGSVDNYIFNEKK